MKEERKELRERRREAGRKERNSKDQSTVIFCLLESSCFLLSKFFGQDNPIIRLHIISRT